MYGLFHESNLFIRQEIEVAYALSCGEPAIVMQTEANEEVDLSVWHVHDFLKNGYSSEKTIMIKLAARKLVT